MKKLFMLMALMVTVAVYGQQKVNVCGDISVYSKNLSTFTGLEFCEEPAMVAHVNTSTQFKQFSVSATYTGQIAFNHVSDGDRFNLLDLGLNYELNENLTLSTGYELTYTDNVGNDEVGHGIFAMAMYHGDKVSTNAIFFADPQLKNRFYIGSADLALMKNVSIYALAGYTNTKDNPLYGLVGVKCTKGDVFVGTYWVFDKDNPGPVISLGLGF